MESKTQTTPPAPTKSVKKRRKQTLNRSKKSVFKRLNKLMRQRRVYICGPRDGTQETTEMNGMKRVNTSGWIVNHAGMLICRGKMATRKKRDDFPTPSATQAQPDDNDGE